MIKENDYGFIIEVGCTANVSWSTALAVQLINLSMYSTARHQLPSLIIINRTQ